MATKRLHLNSQEEALLLFGQNDQYLRELERKYQVQFFIRPSTLPSGAGLTLAIRGRAPQIDKAIMSLEMRRQSPTSTPKSSLERPITEGGNKDMIIKAVSGHAIAPRTANQREYIKAMRDFDMTIGIGPAGTGKTFLAVAFAIAEFESGRFSKIILSRPVVEAGEKLGFLPGDLYEKVHPYLRPLYDAFFTPRTSSKRYHNPFTPFCAHPLASTLNLKPSLRRILHLTYRSKSFQPRLTHQDISRSDRTTHL
jgi:phosphate starvation-inducible PhoH-like protein